MTSMEPIEHPSALWSVHSPRESLQNVHDSSGADGVSPPQSDCHEETHCGAGLTASFLGDQGKARAKVECASWNS